MSAKKKALSKERLYRVLLAPVITEKATMGSQFNQVTFKVDPAATLAPWKLARKFSSAQSPTSRTGWPSAPSIEPLQTLRNDPRLKPESFSAGTASRQVKNSIFIPSQSWDQAAGDGSEQKKWRYRPRCSFFISDRPS